MEATSSIHGAKITVGGALALINSGYCFICSKLDPWSLLSNKQQWKLALSSNSKFGNIFWLFLAFSQTMVDEGRRVW